VRAFGACGYVLGAAANFDDVVLNAPYTAVTFRSLSASCAGAGVFVRWRTASEVDSPIPAIRLVSAKRRSH